MTLSEVLEANKYGCQKEDCRTEPDAYARHNGFCLNARHCLVSTNPRAHKAVTKTDFRPSVLYNETAGAS
jgi:hypothetical protein